jgi:hypothetical protein
VVDASYDKADPLGVLTVLNLLRIIMAVSHWFRRRCVRFGAEVTLVGGMVTGSLIEKW